jgi:hypothetical protein
MGPIGATIVQCGAALDDRMTRFRVLGSTDVHLLADGRLIDMNGSVIIFHRETNIRQTFSQSKHIE